MQLIARTLFVLVGLVHLLPMSGVLSASRLRALYGVTLVDPNLVILLRHRAVLFGIVGAILIAAAFRAPLRPLAAAVGFVSMLSFVAVALLVGDFNAELRRVVLVDVGASVALGAALLLGRSTRARGSR